eukprot:360210-Chlamydomonas_euryale.AAC.5
MDCDMLSPDALSDPFASSITVSHTLRMRTFHVTCACQCHGLAGVCTVHRKHAAHTSTSCAAKICRAHIQIMCMFVRFMYMQTDMAFRMHAYRKTGMACTGVGPAKQVAAVLTHTQGHKL